MFIIITKDSDGYLNLFDEQTYQETVKTFKTPGAAKKYIEKYTSIPDSGIETDNSDGRIVDYRIVEWK